MNDPGLQGISRLLRESPAFRRLWGAQVVSQLGDWFQHVAVMTLLLELTGSGKAVGAALILRMLPVLFVAPWSGVVVDRLDRRRIMIVSDLLRAALVPCFLLVRSAGDVSLVYLLVAVHVSISSFFEPARQALLPNIVERRQLLSANALMSLTWSLTLAIGSALGGLAIALLGMRTAFLFDSASFLISAAFLSRLPGDGREPRPGRGLATGFLDLAEGARYAFGTAGVRSLVFVKCSVGLSGGLVLLLSVLGERRFHVGGSGSLGIGLLFAARGIGTAVGPFLGRAITAYHEGRMRRLLGGAFLQAAVFFVLFGLTDRVGPALGLLFLAHLGTSANWVFSTVLLQMTVPDRFRGRVFAAEMSLFTIAFCAATWTTGHALDDWGVDPGRLASVCGALLVLPAAVYSMLPRSLHRRGAPLA